nr:hypothetical protein [Myxococcota bacterium]
LLAGAQAGDAERAELVASALTERRELLLSVRAAELLRERVAGEDELEASVSSSAEEASASAE